MSGEPGVHLLRGQLHLKRKCQVILNIWIIKILDIPISAGAAQSVKKHDPRRLLSPDFRYRWVPSATPSRWRSITTSTDGFASRIGRMDASAFS